MSQSDARAGQRPTERGSRPAAEIQQSERRGRKLDTLGWFALVLGAPLFGSVIVGVAALVSGIDDDLAGPVFWMMLVAVAIAGLVLVLFGLWAVLRGRRHLQPTLPRLGGEPGGERIVLFLRAFSDDAEYARTAASRFRRWLAWPPPVTQTDVRTEEEQIARGVAPFGRMVALGRPSDRLPRSGAERSYASDEQWRSEALEALDRANIVLLSAGSGESLRWEVEQAVRRDDAARLVLVITRERRHYADFRASVGNLFPKGLPDDPQLRGSRVRFVRAVVWFEPDWTPHWESLTGRFPLFRSSARTQYALPRALHQVYERAGVRAPSKASSSFPRPRAVPASVALFSAFLFGSVVLMGLSLIHFSSNIDPRPGNTGGLVVFVGGCMIVLVALGIPHALWMRRVLCGGPVAFLMLRILCIQYGLSAVMNELVLVLLTLLLVTFEDDVGSWVMLFANAHMLVLAVVVSIVVAKFLFRRDVREWLDSCT